MAYLLNVLYVLLLLVSSPWLVYSALVRGKYRAGWRAKLFGRVPRREGDDFCVWFHAVSVGEVNLLQPLLEMMQVSHPQWEIVISTTTSAGFDLARRKYSPRSVFYCPLDFSWATKAAMRRVRPDMLILVELEIWPNLIRYARRHGAEVAMVNGRLSENSFRGYRRIQWLLKSTFRHMSLIAVQNETYAERFRLLGAPRQSVQVTGSLKFDGAELNRDNERTNQLAQLWGLGGGEVVFLAGSTQSGEEAAAIEVYQRLSPSFPKLRLILVPRHPERFDEVARLLESAGVGWCRRTELSDAAADSGSDPRVLLVDVVGELAAWWGTSQIAFVGGSWGRRGGQNMIEPSAYGAAVSFGPHTENFRDVVASLLDEHAATVVGDQEELRLFVERCLLDPSWASQMGHRAREIVRSHTGATARTMQHLSALVGSK